MKTLKSLFLCLLLVPVLAGAENKINALKNELENTTGKSKITALDKLALALKEESFEEAAEYNKQALELADKLNYRQGKAHALYCAGEVYKTAARYEEALTYYLESLKIHRSMENKKDAAALLRKIGYCYYHLDFYDRALTFYSQAFDLSSKIGDKPGAARSLYLSGHVYWALRNYEKASEFHRRSLKIYEEIGDKKGIADNLTMIGSNDYALGNYRQALENLLASLEIQKKRDHFSAYTPLYLGNIYSKMGDYEKALAYYLHAQKIYKENKNKVSFAQTSLSIAGVYLKMKNYRQAETHLFEALQMAKETENEILMQKIYGDLSDLYSADGQYKKALKYHRLYTAGLYEHYRKNLLKIEEYRERYEAEKREKNRLTRRLLLLIIALFVVIVIVLFIRYREKARTSRVMNEKNIALEKANELKSEFVRIAAHDLKNPLAIILGYTELLKIAFPDNPEVEKKLDHILSSSKQMSRLITELLDSAALEKGKLILNKSDFDFSELAESVVQENLPAAEKKRQEILFSPAGECVIYADMTIVKSIMDNLVNNAIKYSPRGKSIQVEVKKDESRLCFSVRDRGPGLTDEDKNKMFGKFQRLSAKPTGGEFSIGLGLSLVKDFVCMHEGEIVVESEPGQGSTFCVKLPGKSY